MDVRSPFFQNIALIVAGVMFLNPIVTVAAELAVDAAAGGNTTIGQAGNGVPIVNIATPNGSGLSHNKFTDYNVGQQGLILNNGAQAFVPTQQGGYITGNPNLRGGAANVILNEVTGSNRSQLKGYTEVAGQAAHVIVANPHGITCDGCGFINTPRATLSTGAPVVNNGRLQGFDVNGGDIAIEGAGLNASNVDQFDLITRSAQINAEIHAKRLNVIAGRNEVDVATLQATAKADDGSEKPQVAIDSSALGGMYAGAIRLVGTEAGVGVKLAGDMAATAGDIQIDAGGQLTMNRSAASGNTTLVADSVDLKGDTYAGGTARVEAKQVDVRESLAAGEQVKVQAERLNNAGTIEAGVRADGSTNSAGHLQLSGNNVRNAGQLTSHGSLNTDLQKLDNGGGKVAVAGSATLKAKELANQGGQIVAQGNLTLDTDTLNNRQGSALAGQALAIKAEAVDNQAGTLAAGGTITAKVSNALNNDGGLVEAGGHLDVEADSLSNVGGRLRALGSGGESRFTIGSRLNNDSGILEVASAALTFDTPALSNRSGVVRHLGSAGLNLDMDLLGQAGGEFITNSAVSLSAGEWVNNSLLQAASITLDIDRLTQTAGGGLLAVNSLSTTGESWINDGRIETNGSLDLRLSGDYRGNGSLLSQGNLLLDAKRVELGDNARVRG
ncbi:filamentous hemagglutinin N-terminal domain-containing protein, partial [Pseudomonas sp. URMO17WK12:I2]|uniref:filamentous hemagglutinin N-terminal domain-containing protein n=1 Tax=Pseudomonas sp. URMO17WK12:I2 TaxID=1261623 RepID=UPI000DB6A846